jgi:hypothetical protein
VVNVPEHTLRTEPGIPRRCMGKESPAWEVLTVDVQLREGCGHLQVGRFSGTLVLGVDSVKTRAVNTYFVVCDL